MLGLTSDEDTDGHKPEDDKKGKKPAPKPKATKPTPPAPDPDLQAAGLDGDMPPPQKASAKDIRHWYNKAVEKYGSHDEAMKWMQELTGKDKSTDLDIGDIINLNQALKED